MNIKTLVSIGILAAMLGTSGCATILRGTHEKVSVESTPEQALCRIYRQSEGFLKSVVTPGAVYIARSYEPIQIKCQKSGYETTSITAAAILNSDIPGNIAAFPVSSSVGSSIIAPAGIVSAVPLAAGVFIDAANAAHANLPEVIKVELKRIQ